MKLMQFQCDFDPSLMAQFLATVNFGTDDAPTLTWLTKDVLFGTPWKDFCLVLGYGEAGKEDAMGFCPHEGA